MAEAQQIRIYCQITSGAGRAPTTTTIRPVFDNNTENPFYSKPSQERTEKPGRLEDDPPPTVCPLLIRDCGTPVSRLLHTSAQNSGFPASTLTGPSAQGAEMSTFHESLCEADPERSPQHFGTKEETLDDGCRHPNPTLFTGSVPPKP